MTAGSNLIADDSNLIMSKMGANIISGTRATTFHDDAWRLLLVHGRKYGPCRLISIVCTGTVGAVLARAVTTSSRGKGEGGNVKCQGA
jgi:hypothetical protein